MPKETDVTTVVMTEDELDAKLNNSYKVGISVGLDQASTVMMLKSQEYFKYYQDELASRYRDISNEFKKLSDQEHPRRKDA